MSFTVYLVQKNADMTEGRGPMVNDACFSKEATAKFYANSQRGVMGRKAPVDGWDKYSDWQVIPLVVAESLEELNSVRKEERRQIALDKLTHEDKVALGLVP